MGVCVFFLNFVSIHSIIRVVVLGCDMWIIQKKSRGLRKGKDELEEAGGKEGAALKVESYFRRTRRSGLKERAKKRVKVKSRRGGGGVGPSLTIVPFGRPRPRRTVCSSTECLGGNVFRGHKLSAGYRRRMLDAAFSV